MLWSLLLNCRKANNLLSAYMDGELAGIEQLAIREHLKNCSSCNYEYESLLQTKRMLSGLSMRNPSQQMEQRILASIAREQIVENRRSNIASLWGSMPYNSRLKYSAYAAVAALAICIFAVNLTNRDITAHSIAGLPPVSGKVARTNQPLNSVQPVSDNARAMIFIHNPNEYSPPSQPATVNANVTEPRFELSGSR